MSAEEQLNTQQFWHLTSRKDFKPSDKVRPVSGGGWHSASQPMLHVTTSPHYWARIAGGAMGTPYAAKRRWAAEVEPTDEHPPVQRESALSPETVLDPTKVRVKRIIPTSEALKETTGYDPVSGASVPHGYRYDGPDFPPRRKRR